MKLFAFFVSLALLSGFSLFNKQQSDHFSGDAALYPDELYEFMRNISEEKEDILTGFMQMWEDSLFTPQQQQDIITLSQMLENKNARPTPHFLNFMTCWTSIKENNFSGEQYQNWLDGFQYHLKQRKVKTSTFNSILTFTSNLLSENIIFKSSSTQWKASSKNYRIVSDKGIQIVFDKTNLTCYAKRDSMELYETKGSLDPTENIWRGDGGLVSWERGGYEREEVFARLADYQIELSKSEYFAKGVSFTNRFYFTEPLEGELHDKVKLLKNTSDATYPKFYSYTKEFEIKDLYKDIDYQGGLSMQGAKLVGTGTRENTAKLKIYRNDTLVLLAKSVFFGFKSDRISSQKTSIAIRLQKDSIYHPDLIFSYRVPNRELALMKSENFSSQGPYFNSYHNVDMNFDYLSWRMDEDFMKFTAGRSAAVGNAYFESVNYFNYNKFLDMQGMDRVHPLISLRSFAKKVGSEEFTVEDYADYLRMPLHLVKQMAMRMAFSGFVFYDQNTEIITLKPRLHDYLAASINRIDYDVIGFASKVEAPLENALFDLTTNDLIINGINQIQVSDSQNVIIYPNKSRIILKRNRNFQFDGKVEAGLLSFYGNNFFFNYDAFKVSLQNVDSISMGFLSGGYDNFGLPRVESIQNALQHVTGELLIDKPNNKSGRESFPQYPIFKSKESSYVYWDDPTIQKGAYESNDFFFEVYAFEMDSLDNYAIDNFFLEGVFISAGIFPSFEQKLVLQPDNSLGFRQKTPQEGFPLYGGKGTYSNEIWLSNQGLKGDGSLDYITSTTFSDDFNFYPDSMNTLAKEYVIERQSTGQQYPFTSSLNNDIHWLPYANVMFAQKTDVDFTMFNDTTVLKGNLELRPEGLTGSGRMDLKNSDLVSDLFTYDATNIYADTADFYLKSLNTDGFTVLTENMNSHISFTERMGWFKSNEGYTLVDFPENRYVSYIDLFIWDMKNTRLAMGSEEPETTFDPAEEDIEPEGPRYISVHYEQDSLNFVSPKAYYDYRNNIIDARGVKFIEVADARIYPKEGLIKVKENANMETLIDAVVRTNKKTKHHTIHTATLTIKSRSFYSGMGNYDYIDENDEVQVIHFSEVKVDTGKHTIANGEIFEAANFKLSPVYKYQGKVSLYADKPLLNYNGSVKIEHNCDKLSPDWLYFTSEIDPLDIYIPVDEQAVNMDRNKIYTGMYMYYDSVHVYPAFFTKRKAYSDWSIVNSYGYMHYDKAGQLFKIGSKEKIQDFSLAENYLSFHREDCILYGEGDVDLGQDLGQLKMKSVGNVKHNNIKNETTFDVVMGLDFFMQDEYVNIMANEIDSVPNLEAVRMNRPVYLKAMNKLIGEEEYGKFRDELNLFGTIKEIPLALKHTMLFSDLKLIWNDDANSYQSVGKIGIASINNVQINKKVDGFIEIRIKRSGDIFDMYLQLDRRTYYYFGYTRGVMQALSSNRAFVDGITTLKPKDRKKKVGRGETSYIYMISTERKKNNFYRRYRDIIEGEEVEDE